MDRAKGARIQRWSLYPSSLSLFHPPSLSLLSSMKRTTPFPGAIIIHLPAIRQLGAITAIIAGFVRATEEYTGVTDSPGRAVMASPERRGRQTISGSTCRRRSQPLPVTRTHYRRIEGALMPHIRFQKVDCGTWSLAPAPTPHGETIRRPSGRPSTSRKALTKSIRDLGRTFVTKCHETGRTQPGMTLTSVRARDPRNDQRVTR